MKKFLALFVSALILLTACSSGHDDRAELYKKGFHSGFNMSFRGYDLLGSMQKEESGIFTLELVKPDELRGLCVTVEDGNSIISLDGIVINSYDNEDIEASFACVLYRIFVKLAYKSDTLTFGKNKITGNTVDGEFTVVTEDDGSLKSIELKEAELTVNLTDFSFEHS